MILDVICVKGPEVPVLASSVPKFNDKIWIVSYNYSYDS